MFRIFELLGLVAPIGGVVILFIYRRRSLAGFAWGLSGCLVALAGSGIGVLAVRSSMFGAMSEGGGFGGVEERLEPWGLARLGITLLAAVPLIVGALADRRGGSAPRALIASGGALTLLGAAVHAVPVELGHEHEGLNVLVAILVETVEFGLIGLGILVLSVAVVALRGGSDGRTEPADLLRRAGGWAWRAYSASRRRGGR